MVLGQQETRICPLCLQGFEEEEELIRTVISSDWDASGDWFLCHNCFYGLIDMDHDRLPFNRRKEEEVVNLNDERIDSNKTEYEIIHKKCGKVMSIETEYSEWIEGSFHDIVVELYCVECDEPVFMRL